MTYQLSVAIVALVAFANPALGKVMPQCTAIPGIPFVIESPGCYRLQQNLTIKDPAATALLVRSDNVRIDLGKYRLQGSGDPHGSGVGIAAHGVHNVAVENGTISGFLYGLQVGHDVVTSRPTNRFSVFRTTLSDNTFRGAAIEGNNVIVDGITVKRTGGSQLFADAHANGLEIDGKNCRIRHNRILETYPVGKGESAAIALPGEMLGCTLKGNKLANTRVPTEAKTFGIWLKNGDWPLQIKDNQINGFSLVINTRSKEFAPSSSAMCSVISKLPYVVEMPGCYRLSRDFELKDTHATGILIRSNNVRIDMATHEITGPRDPHSTAVGIAAYGVHDVIVESGKILGFWEGLSVGQDKNAHMSTNVSVRKIHFLDNSFRGIIIQGKNTSVKNVMVERTGGALFVPDAFAIGIELDGPACQILDSKVMATHAVGVGETVGISLTDNAAECLIQNNQIKNAINNNATRSFGIWIGGKSPSVQVLENQIEGFTYAFPSTLKPPEVPFFKPTIYERNIARRIGCSPANMPHFYEGMSNSNVFEDNLPECFDTAHYRLKQMNESRTPERIFRAAQALYSCNECQTFHDAIHLARIEHAIPLLEEAAGKGLKEAQRILPGVRAVIEKLKDKTSNSNNTQ